MLTFVEVTDPSAARDLYPLLSDLDDLYPDFDQWYSTKVIPHLGSDQTILVAAYSRSMLAGVSIGKRTEEEVKLRCVRMEPRYQRRGYGLALIEHMLKRLDCDRPHCSVSEELLHHYSRAFVNRFNFNLTEVSKGVYRPGKLEYLFN